jgi:hypothetical protein
MKTTRNILSIVIAAGTAGVALLAISNIISADIALAIIAVSGLAGFAALDYSRNLKSLRVPGRLLRPTLPVAANVAAACTVRRAA